MNNKIVSEKISLLRKIKNEDEEVKNLFNIVCLYYPILLDAPQEAPKSIINEYNRLVRGNVSNFDLQKTLII